MGTPACKAPELTDQEPLSYVKLDATFRAKDAARVIDIIRWMTFNGIANIADCSTDEAYEYQAALGKLRAVLENAPEVTDGN